jgi:hypothetical protein
VLCHDNTICCLIPLSSPNLIGVQIKLKVLTAKERLGEHKKSSLLARLKDAPILRFAAAVLLLPTFVYVFTSRHAARL